MDAAEMTALRRRFNLIKGPPKSLAELEERHIAWLTHYFEISHDLSVTAGLFGIAPGSLRSIRDSPGGQEFALRKVGGNKAVLNLHAAHFLMQKMINDGTQLSVDVLLKIYTATLPRENTQPNLPDLLNFADKLADQYNFGEEERELLRTFAKTGSVGT